MRTLPAQSSNNNLNTQSRTIVVVALFLFALSGLISGFAVGAFARPRTGPLSTIGPIKNTPVAQKTSTPSPTPTVQPVSLGFPIIHQLTNPERADGTTSYTVSAYPVDQSTDKGHGKAVYAPGITCRLWLLKQTSNPHNIPADRLKSPTTLSDPFPGEVTGLQFASNSPGTQACNATTNTTWTYTVASSVDAGAYYLVVLTDWAGVHYNWSWASIAIKKAD